jgi:hypothetical protein
MTLARILSVLVCAGLLFHSWMAFSITGILPGYAGSFYWFTIPHLVVLPLSTVSVALDAVRRKRATFIATLICISCLLPTRFFAGRQWPGGDDGPGIAWVYGIGLASLLSTVVGLPLVCVAHRLYTRAPNAYQARGVNSQ